ncbi:GH36-type glycosyl hydrolase domain-containing protein [Candidatus Omnitrophota bacterium]
MSSHLKPITLLSTIGYKTKVAFCVILLGLFILSTGAIAAPTFNLLDAEERGLNTSETAKGILTPSFDEKIQNDTLECRYSIEQGAALEVWVKSFPAAMTEAGKSSIKLSVNVPDAVQAESITVKIELKGTVGSQGIPLTLQRGWNSIQDEIEWSVVGVLNEIVFAISHQGESEVAKGSLAFALDFKEKALLEEIVEPVKDVIEKVTAIAPKPIPSSFSILDAGKRGLDKNDFAKGLLVPTFDEAVEKDVLEVKYSISQNARLKLWATNFSSYLNPDVVNIARIGVRINDQEQVGQINMNVTLKGDTGEQVILLPLKRGWNSIQTAIDWDAIGTFSEAALFIGAIGSEEPATGTISFALDFVKGSMVEKARAVDSHFTPGFGLLDIERKGTFNIGDSNGICHVAYDEIAQKDVFEFEYSAPKGTYVGVWTQQFPPEMGPDTVDAVKIGVKVPTVQQIKEVAVKLEVKGENGMQIIPITLSHGWSSIKETVNWSMVGTLKEVVFVVNSMGGEGDVAAGMLYFDLEFGTLSFIQKHFTYIKVGLVLIVSFFMAWLISFIGIRLTEKRNAGKINLTNDKNAIETNDSIATKLKSAFFYGIIIVIMAAVAVYIHYLGTMTLLEAGCNVTFLVVGLAGALVAEMFKFKLTGKHLIAREVFQNVFLSGLIAAASSKQGLLQAPATWAQLLTVSNVTAMLTFIIYHGMNALTLSGTGKHIKAITGALLVGTPFLFGWLLVVENANLVALLSNSLTLGIFGTWPTVVGIIGRFLVVLGFNELVTNGIHLLIQGKLIKERRVHIATALVSLGVAIAPVVADLGSTQAVASLPLILRAIVAIVATAISFAGLWGEVYLITGIALDCGKHTPPSWETFTRHVVPGVKKGMAYSGILVAIMYITHMLLKMNALQSVMSNMPLVIGVLAGALIFPLVKTIIETFDGSLPFFDRMKYSYCHASLYFRGAVVGFGFSYMVSKGMFQSEMADRIKFGLLIGLFASAGVSFLRDVYYAFRGCGKIQTWKLYLTDACLGIFVGSAAAFYLDSRQVPVVVEKFKLYISSGFDAIEYITYPLVNKWGRIDLGTYTGGVKLLFTESLAGVINWSIAAWLFAINKVFMQAFFDKDKAPIKFFFSKAGFAVLIEHMIYVLRWGLWMSPIIFTFLRMMPDPTWYNQDGAIRTIFAVFNNATMTSETFQAWSLQMFVYVLAFDFFRVIIWMDHMGLRVATLVNLSFLGLDKLDEKVSRVIGPAAAQRYIPEGVKRFATWAPLLIPFYLPRGADWDYAWGTSEAMQNAAGPGIFATIQAMNGNQKAILIIAGIIVCTLISYIIHLLCRRSRARRVHNNILANRRYKVVLKENGEIYSEVDHQKSSVYPPEYDVTRRSYDPMHPCGRILYVVDAAKSGKDTSLAWPIVGNFPTDRFEASEFIKGDDSLKIVNNAHGILTTIDIRLPDMESTAEIWTVTIDNMTEEKRDLKVVTYLEWVLNGGLHDRFHTQYARLFPEMSYVTDVNAILAWQKGTKSMGILAAEENPEGFLSTRVDFIGRARSVWSPRVFETLDFMDIKDTAPYPTFDPIGSLMLNASVGPRESKTIRLMVGYETSRDKAINLIKTYLKPKAGTPVPEAKQKKRNLLIGHGEIPPGTPQPYSEYIDNGKKLHVKTVYTTRPYDHAMSNPMHSLMVTNRGLHTSCNGNSQQNRLTPDWPDLVGQEVPAEAIYMYDVDTNEWLAPTYFPLQDTSAHHDSEFGVDGTAVFRMKKGTIETELTTFVPSDEPMGCYLLKVKNTSDKPRRIRIAPYFHMVLSFQSEQSGTLQKRYDKSLDALFFKNPRNMFRVGTAFVSMSLPTDCVETNRGKFFGVGRGVDRPFMVEKGVADNDHLTETGQVASFTGTLEIPAKGEGTVAIVMGQTDAKKDAVALVEKYKDVTAAERSLEATKKWWLGFTETTQYTTNNKEFNYLQNWLKYQAVAERIWARRGLYQTSGAFGFRDQLQDTVNLLWVDPALARKQIILHASHQFTEGDVFHWFFTLTDGRTAFACRSHASDNLLWLCWAVVEYLRATGDETLLDEITTYVVSEFPFAKLPKNPHGWGHLYHRSTRGDSVYRHCLRSIDLVFNKRTGINGLPLIQTGDWNDGLDEIGSQGRGESVWLGFFLFYILQGLLDVIEKKDGKERRDYYEKKMNELKDSLEATWRNDRYLRAFHDDGTEIGVEGSGMWETDALTAAWAVMSGINAERELTVFNTALRVLERDNAVLLGWPALREDSKPYLGRSSKYPEGVRENGMYCHGVQWLIRAARILVERFEKQGDSKKAAEYREIAYRLWLKITPVSHTTPKEIETYGGQPNKQPADILTTYDRGRMIWNGYTGAAGWLFRQAVESVIGGALDKGEMILPKDLDKPRGALKVSSLERDITKSPFKNMK